MSYRRCSVTDHRDIVAGERVGISEAPYVVPNVAQARRIASEWGTSRDSALRLFAEDGSVNLGPIMKEIGEIHERLPDKGPGYCELLALIRFVAEVGDRGPTDDLNWSTYWDPTPAHRWRYGNAQYERLGDSDRCAHKATRGTGIGACNRPLDRQGNCDRPSNHVE